MNEQSAPKKHRIQMTDEDMRAFEEFKEFKRSQVACQPVNGPLY